MSILLIIIIAGIIFLVFWLIRPAIPSNKVCDEATYKNIEYRKGMYLDILMPTNKVYSKPPIIIFYHGGGFIHGRKNEVATGLRRGTKTKLLSSGFALVTVNYYMARNSVASFPKCTEDAQTSFAWVTRNADKYGLDKSNIGTWGTSSGATLALMVGFTNSNSINFIVDEFGPTNLNMYRKADFLGFLKRRAAKNSPINFIPNSDIPILIIHGMIDTIVPYTQSEILVNKLKEEGHRNYKLIPVKNAAHILVGASKEVKEKCEDEIVNFSKANLK